MRAHASNGGFNCRCSGTRLGHAHVKTVRESGGALVGHRPLKLDGGLAGLIASGDLETMCGSTWGYLYIEELAHAQFGRHFAEDPRVALERPAGFHSG